jgi:DNA mismatch repair protein MutS2
VGDQQSLSESLSTFSAHIGFLGQLVHRCGTGSLVLMDEMLTGTEPQEGAALAAAVLEHLVARDATVVITTHYGDLKRLATANPGVVNASVSFDAERLQPTYRLIPQLPGSSFAFPIARRYGLPDAIVEAAQERLSHRAEDVESLLAQLHEREHALAEQESHLRDQQRHQEARAASQESRETELRRRERELRAQERGAVSNELRQARRQIAAVIHKLQAANDLPRAGAVQQELQAVAQALVHAPPVDERGLTPAALRGLPAAARLWVRSEGRHARLRMGTLTMDVDAGDLSLDTGPAPTESRRTQRRRQEAAEAAQRGASTTIETTGPAVSTSENTLDLRGQRVEEALEHAERFLDLCVVKHVSPVILIHGHGTGRLRTALREYLGESPYCSTWRAGERNEGGDGVTIAALSL